MNAIPLAAVALCLVAGPAAALAPQGAEGPVYTAGGGVSAPILVKQVKPQYTSDAMRARVQGVVTLECVVQPDGAIGEARVAKPLNPGLDQEAIKAAKQWRFKPGRKDGKPVAVRVTLELTFSMGDPTFKFGARPADGVAINPPQLSVRPLTTGDTVGTGAGRQPEAPVVYKPGDGVSAPVVVKEARPQYTPDAKGAKIQGTVVLECVVQPDGTIGDVKVTRSLDAGLDQEAIKAVRQWRFEPGTKDGKPVPVLVTLEMTFTLR